MENKNKTFCGYKLSQKTILSLMKILLALVKKSVEVLDELQDTKYGKVNKLWQKLFDQH